MASTERSFFTNCFIRDESHARIMYVGLNVKFPVRDAEANMTIYTTMTRSPQLSHVIGMQYS